MGDSHPGVVGSFPRVLRNPVWLERYSGPPLFTQNKQMINCLISNCAGRHTTQVPAGGAAKRFILFNSRSKTNVAFHPLPACMGPLGPEQGRGTYRGALVPAWHFRTGVSLGVGGGDHWKGSRQREHEIAQKCKTVSPRTVCMGIHFPRNRTELEETLAAV